MAKIKWKSWRDVKGKAWVLRWKKTGKGRRYYIKHAPDAKIRMFTIGKEKPTHYWKASLISKEAAQVSHLTLEATRISCNRYLRAKLGRDNYLLRILPYPHHIVRQHKLMAFAGADRLQSGMRHAFGKPFGRAARIKPDQKLLYVKISKNDLDIAKQALRRAKMKWPMPSKIVIEKIIPDDKGDK